MAATGSHLPLSEREAAEGFVTSNAHNSLVWTSIMVDSESISVHED
jgi:hypothetical protein